MPVCMTNVRDCRRELVSTNLQCRPLVNCSESAEARIRLTRSLALLVPYDCDSRRNRVSQGVPIATTIIAVALLGSASSAQTFLDFRNVPTVSTQSPDVFRGLFSRGHCGTVRGILLGDSQETCPYGLGAVYFPRLNYELFVRYGNTPETPLMGPTAHTGGGVPWAQWLLRNANPVPGVTASRLPPSALPPLLGAGKSTLANGSNINANQTFGAIYMLQHRADNVDPGTLLPGSQDFFERGDAVFMDIYGVTTRDGGDIVARVTPASTSTPSYFEPTVVTLTLGMGPESDADKVRRHRIGPFAFGGLDYMQVELSGSHAHKFTEILGARFVSGADNRGWAITSFAAGGYQTQHYIQFHAESGPVLAALEPDVMFLAFGANDFGNGRTPAEFRANTLALIDFVRGAISPELPIILLADPDRVFDGTPPGSAANSDFLSGVLHDIATSVPNVCAVNGRLLTHQHGWTRHGDLSTFLSDTVHYNPFGARLKAQLEIDALYSTFGTRCYADMSDSAGNAAPDCAVTIDDLLLFLFAFEQGTAFADLDDDGDPSSSNPDGAVDINDLLFFIAHFESGC